MSSRTRLVSWAVVGALALGTACSGGGGNKNSGQGTTQPTEPEVAAVTTTTAPAGDVETFEVFSTKNPFIPLTGAGGTGTGTTGGGTGTGTGTGTGGTTTGGGTTGEGGAAGGVEPQRAQRVALLDVFTEGGQVKANVRVDSTVHKVGVGDTFADRYKVLSLSLSDECGRFLFGDDAFRLCKGEQALK